MKAFDVFGSEVVSGIPVASDPYPHIVLGSGGHKRATWIALGKRDANSIVRPQRLPCPRRNEDESIYEAEVPAEKQAVRTCDKCRQNYGDWAQQEEWSGSKYLIRKHPNAGEVDGPSCVFDVGVIQLKETEGKPNSKYLIVSLRGDDNRALVLWRVSSGYRGDASITAGEDVMIIASDSSWHSGRGSLGETAETLAILKPGQELIAQRSGRRVQDSYGRLSWDGKTLKITFGGVEMLAATSDEVEGDYL